MVFSDVFSECNSRLSRGAVPNGSPAVFLPLTFMKNKILLSFLCIVVVMTTILCIPASAAGDDGIIDFKFDDISLAYYTVRDMNGNVLPTVADSSNNTITISNADLISAPSNSRYVVFSGALNLVSVPAKSDIQLALSIEIGSNTSTWKNGPKWVGRTSQLNGGSILTTGTATFTGDQIISYKIPMSSLEDGTYFFGFEIPYFYIDGQVVDYENLKISFVNLSITTQDGHVYGKNNELQNDIDNLDDAESQIIEEVGDDLNFGTELFGDTITQITTPSSPILQGLLAMKTFFGIMLNDFGGVWIVFNSLISFSLVVGIWAFLLNVLPGAIRSIKSRFKKE